jgi:hypothetical protein
LRATHLPFTSSQVISEKPDIVAGSFSGDSFTLLKSTAAGEKVTSNIEVKFISSTTIRAHAYLTLVLPGFVIGGTVVIQCAEAAVGSDVSWDAAASSLNIVMKDDVSKGVQIAITVVSDVTNPTRPVAQIPGLGVKILAKRQETTPDSPNRFKRGYCCNPSSYASCASLCGAFIFCDCNLVAEKVMLPQPAITAGTFGMASIATEVSTATYESGKVVVTFSTTTNLKATDQIKVRRGEKEEPEKKRKGKGEMRKQIICEEALF